MTGTSEPTSQLSASGRIFAVQATHESGLSVSNADTTLA